MKKSMKTWQEEIRNNDNSEDILLLFEIIIICLQHMVRIQTILLPIFPFGRLPSNINPNHNYLTTKYHRQHNISK